ncbi:MAG TPA: tripartite tricarboxylate transporter TctB family protein [Candidatus Limnocylindria bacterium]|nr:tripartite tricarboxylate transporter TctB family protein [Candidatus Limnocylindria bacterium]
MEETTPRASPARARSLLGPRLVGAALVVLGALILWQALQIGQVRGFSPVGPSIFPLAIGGILLLLAAAFLARTTILPDDDLAARAADEERATHWPTPLVVAVLLVAYAVALDGMRLDEIRVPGLGYVIATALFVPAAARVLGSRALLRDALIGVVLASVVYFTFTEYLGVNLPAGILDLVL